MTQINHISSRYYRNIDKKISKRSQNHISTRYTSKYDIHLVAKSYISVISEGYHNRISKRHKIIHQQDVIKISKFRYPIACKIIYQQDIIVTSKNEYQIGCKIIYQRNIIVISKIGYLEVKK